MVDYTALTYTYPLRQILRPAEILLSDVALPVIQINKRTVFPSLRCRQR